MGYDVTICARCGAGFADGIPEQADLDRYYLEQSKYSYDTTGGAESPYDLRRFEVIADQLIPYIPNCDCRILDVGCATGGLLSVFKRRGYTNILGVDPSPACADAAYRLYGIEVRAAVLSLISAWKEKFDVIIAVGVFEHVREVRNAVQTLASCLNRSGLIFAAVPDVARLAECHDAPYQQFSMEHINFFSSASLERLMASNAFRTTETWKTLVEWRERITEPVLSGLFTLQPQNQRDSHLLFDFETEPALRRYLDRSQAEDRSIAESIVQLVKSREPVLIWGAGTLTRRLLATTTLRDAAIAGFVDSNPHIQGQYLIGKIVYSPEQIVMRSERILICSITFKHEIINTIRAKYKLPNQLFLIGSR